MLKEGTFGYSGRFDPGKRYWEKPVEERARDQGRWHGCPISGEVIERYGARGAELRYGECNVWTREIWHRTRGTALYPILTSSVLRREDELVGRYENKVVPKSHLQKMSPMSTPWGYASARVLLTIAGPRNERNDKSILNAWDDLDKTLLAMKRNSSSNPLEMLARLCNKAHKRGVPSTAILHQALCQGYLEEENTQRLFEELKKEIKKHAPKVYKDYTGWSDDQKREFGVAN